jgi:hypothetical protein
MTEFTIEQKVHDLEGVAYLLYRLSENVSCTIMPPWRQAFHSIEP